METVLIAGGTGLVGTALRNLLLQNGYRVILLSRAVQKTTSNVNIHGSNEPFQNARWDPATGIIDKIAFAQADYIVNLAGAGVAEKRWTDQRKKEIVDSRIKSGQLLVKALTEIPNNVKAVINASAIGWYGADDEKKNREDFKEEHTAANGFLGQTCKQWEDSVDPVSSLGVRLVKLRIGIVLSNRGGALAEFIKPLRLGVAAILGNGRQVISWIHINDLCGIILYAIQQPTITGIYNAVAPNPVTNRQLTLGLAKTRNGSNFISIPVPGFILTIVMGEMSVEILKSTTVSAEKIQKAGYVFLYPTINNALKGLLNK
ncbi:MAG: TIGR01777 family oxidoreductase [Chitinophagaceae bacterium]